MTFLFFNTAEEALYALTEQLVTLVSEKHGEPFYIALSGSTTAQKMFGVWVNDFRNRIPWSDLRFFWVDERCVPSGDDDSNFGHADRLLFRPLHIPESHVFRIRGEENPEEEAGRYARTVAREIPHVRGELPVFDAIILGIGTDGHTASIFPSGMSLITDKRLYAVSAQPQSGQLRITMTGTLILNAAYLLVPVIGQDKCDVLKHLIEEDDPESPYPSARILEQAGAALLTSDCKLYRS